jgi:hypothetical protein
MSAAFHLGVLNRRLLDSFALFRHQSREAEEFYGEASHRWRDQRGAAFARRFLEPQLFLVAPVSAALSELGSHIAKAAEFVAASERQTAVVRVAAEEIEGATDAALRFVLNAAHLAVDAVNQARSAEAAASDAKRRTALLGSPPI